MSLSPEFEHYLSIVIFNRMVLGLAWGPGGIAALIGPPLGAALLGKDYIWWRGVVFAAVRMLSTIYEKFIIALRI